MTTPRVPSSISTTGSTSTSGSSHGRLSLNNIRVTNLYKATMNRFLTRKKAQGAPDGNGPMPSTRKSKKGKKGQPPPRPELDLSVALPSSDNFRTSLLMPNLSARFSMLREQDDPESKLGKASDDSVLFPKRQSRLLDFGYAPTGLSDIAEVSSINGSLRPPFAYGRSGSVDGGYGTDDDSVHSGSIMNRSRAGEGNVLFGGRQKVYLGNRALYDGDIGLSPYQRMKREERRKRIENGEEEEEEEEEEEPQSQEDTAPGSPTQDLKHSSSFSGSLWRRETASSTASGAEARVSTAATSIASQGANSVQPSAALGVSGLDRQGTKGRRLYEQGLDRNIHEQQSSAMSRLNSLQMQRTALGGRATPPLMQTRSATSLNERCNRSGTYRVASPPPSAPLANMSSFMAAKEGDSAKSSPILGMAQSPTSPQTPISPVEENNPLLSSAINPGDRGKATAMGTFNKPARQFDENQYLQRQKQMLEGRETPPPSRKPSPPSQAQDQLDVRRSEPKVKPNAPSKLVQDARSRLDMLHGEIAADMDFMAPVLESEEQSTVMYRTRSNSSGVAAPAVPRVPASPPKPASPEKKPATPSAFSVFQRAAVQMRTGAAIGSPQPSPEQQPQTFFSSPGSGSDDDEPSRGTLPEPLLPRGNSEIPKLSRNDRSPASIASPASSQGHPALRTPENAFSVTRASEDMVLVLTSPQDTVLKPSASNPVEPDAGILDSPTLGPDNGGLNGMVRQHLRQQSEQSSIYDDNPPDDHYRSNHLTAQSMLSDTPGHSSYSHSNPWDLEDLDGGYYGEADSLSSVSPVDAAKSKGQPFPRSSGNVDPLRIGAESVTPWEHERSAKHHRSVSQGTQAERDAFEKELVERQKAIQETLRSKVEAESRSSSPTFGVGAAFKNFGIPRARSSRDSLTTRPVKAINVLGHGANASSTSLARSSEEQRNRPWGKQPKNDDEYRQDFEDRLTRGASGDANYEAKSSAYDNGRNRSGSTVSGRSRSRTGRHGSDNEGDAPPFMPAQYPRSGLSTLDSMPSPVVEQSAGYPPPPRMRSNSRPAAPGSSNAKSLHPIQTLLPTGPGVTRISPGLAAGRSPAPGPSPSILRPSPSFGKHSNLSSPQISGTNTPVSPAFPQPQPAGRNTSVPRKKSIQKSIISEPMFVSSTSVVDTIELPTGASLRNGMNQQATPPLPPINPMRRRFGFKPSRSDSRGSASTGSESRMSTDECDKKQQRGRSQKSSNPTLKMTAREQQRQGQENEEPTPGGAFKISGPQPVENGGMF